MYLFDFIFNAPAFNFISRSLSMKPFIISCSAYLSKFTKYTDRITICFVFFFNCLINLSMFKQA